MYYKIRYHYQYNRNNILDRFKSKNLRHTKNMKIDKKIDASTNLTFIVSDICQPILKDIQSAKNIIATNKIRNNYVGIQSFIFQYCDSNIGLFSIAPCKVITPNPFCILFGISSLLLF